MSELGIEDDDTGTGDGTNVAPTNFTNTTFTNMTRNASSSSAFDDDGCTLDECAACDDEVSAPTFERYAGRTRQRSGLLSTSVRSCTTLPRIVHESCPKTVPLSVSVDDVGSRRW
jgi:hypothetical protein